jgi:hypothetical protein
MESADQDRPEGEQSAGRGTAGEHAASSHYESLTSRARGAWAIRRWLAGGAIATLLLVAFLPQLVALSPLRHEIPRFRVRGFEGRIRVGQASLAWWRAPVLNDLELFAPDGEPFIQIDQFIEQRSVLTLVFRPGEAADMQVVRPVVTLKLRPDGSNVADAMAPVLEYRKQHPSKPKERQVDIENAVLKVIDSKSNQTVEWNEIALRIHSSPTGPRPNELQLSARLADAANAGPLTVDASWPPSGGDPALRENSETRISVKTSELPLGALAPLLSRWAPDLDVSGTTTADVNLQFHTESEKPGHVFQVTGKVTTNALSIVCPSRLGNDRFSLPEIHLEGNATADGTVCHVERFQAQSDVGRIEAHGRFPMRGVNGPGDSAAANAKIEAADFELEGTIDLVRLANLIPATLRLREGTQLTEGAISLNVSSRVQEGQSQWRGRFETSKLAARVGEEQVTWDQPIRLAFELSRNQDRIEINQLTCESDFVELSGRGNSDNAHVTANCDLDKFGTQAGRFIDLEGCELHGQVKLTGDLKRDADRLLNVALQATIENFSSGKAGEPAWSEPKLVADLQTQLVEKSLRLTEVRSARFTLSGEGDTDRLTMALAEPVALTDGESQWDLTVGLAGNLARWQDRLRPFGIGGEGQIEGALDSTMALHVSRQSLGIDELVADIKSLRIHRAGLDLHDPEVRLTATARWNGADRRFSVSEANLVGNAGEVHARELLLVRHEGELPELTGRVSLKTDLDRLNPPETPAGERPWSGKVTGDVEFRRDADQTTGVWQFSVEDLFIRRRVTKFVEHRRGEVEPIAPEPPPARIPRPAPGVPIDRKTRRAIEKAEREAKRERRHQEREARKRAEQIVLVPETEWKTTWADPRLSLSGTTRFDPGQDRIELAALEMTSEGIHLKAQGTLTEASTRAVVDLKGEVDYDLEKLVARLQETLGDHVRVTGQEHRRFSLNGPLRSVTPDSGDPSRAVQLAESPVAEPSPEGGAVVPASHVVPAERSVLGPPELNGAAGAGWQGADLFGLKAGPAEIDLRLAKGILAMQPLEMTLSGGKVKLAPRVLLDNQPAMVILPKGPMIENVELSQDLCDTWLRYVAPILSDAARVEGRFSVDLDESHLALNAPAAGDLSGRLLIDTAQVLPGPLFAELADYLSEIESAVTRSAPGDLLGRDKPLVRIDRQTVSFKLREGRLYSSPLEFNVRNVRVRTRGSVGVDQSLDLVAEIFLPAEWVRRVSFLARLEGKALEIPIRGTLRHPKLDGSGIGRFWEQFGQDALNNLLNGVVPRRPDR